MAEAPAVAKPIAAPKAAETPVVEKPSPEVEAPVAPEPPPEPSYGLDLVPREVPERGRIHCPEVELERYRGSVIRYHKPLRIYVGFEEHLRRFEEIVRDTAIEFYGRPPRRIKHLGSFYCRRIRLWPTFVSEHGLGNALDVEGFDFAWISKKKAPGVPARLRRAFQVRVKKHWDATRGVGAVHSKFLHTLAQRLIDEPGLFRVMLGPAEPGHQDHFHLDMAPWRIVNIFPPGEEPEEGAPAHTAGTPAATGAPSGS